MCIALHAMFGLKLAKMDSIVHFKVMRYYDDKNNGISETQDFLFCFLFPFPYSHGNFIGTKLLTLNTLKVRPLCYYDICTDRFFFLFYTIFQLGNEESPELRSFLDTMVVLFSRLYCVSVSKYQMQRLLKHAC